MAKWKASSNDNGYIVRWFTNNVDFVQSPWIKVNSLQMIEVEYPFNISSLIATVRLDKGGLYTLVFEQVKD
jgi:hypothetical protein